jgi:biotin carboxyl carrier protein
MELEIKINGRLTKVSLISRDKNCVKVQVDGKIYDLDMCKVEEHEYSVLSEGQSHNIEIVQGETPKRFLINTYYRSFDIEIVDAEARYQQSRNRGTVDQSENNISTPMPGKVVRIPVKVNQKVMAGETVIVISAMKMESEYKVNRDGIIKKIMVAEGEVVKSNQILVVIE